MLISTGCTILRDEKGRLGEMIIHRRPALSEAEEIAYCRMFLDAADAALREHRRLERIEGSESNAQG